ncbi:MAG: cell division topological specificity factor MinE [Lachnospiraceae bacterium]|nr:cell division topological specificity factor MinE [Lachnospiraceae bacterium]
MFFDNWRKNKNTGDEAKRRLMLSIVSDRAGCSPEVMEQIKNDFIQVISKYVEIDSEGLEIKVASNEKGPSLTANIPIKNIRKKKED